MRILIVDDEENIRRGLETFLGLSGHEVLALPTLGEARAALLSEGSSFGAALVDVFVGRDYGVELLDTAAEAGLRLPIVMMSGQGRVRDAVAALSRGARDFLEKPLDTARLLSIIQGIEREAAAGRRIEALEEAWLADHVHAPPGSALRAALETARRAAASPLSVLVTGPTGTGKELVARWIHLASPRARGPFVAVNCAAVPAELADSAFFGSLRGAYTGAETDRKGWFQGAKGGTLFLDEIGELGLPIQAKLLRAVESGEIQMVGASSPSGSDVRLVAATNRDLGAEIRAGRFREDLYWRLAQTTIALSGLAERRSEIRGLAEFFVGAFRAGRGGEAPRLDDEALAWLEARDWPGNVRELRALIERALWLAPPGFLIGPSFLETLGPGGASKGGAGPIRSAGPDRSSPASPNSAASQVAQGAGAGLSLSDAKLAFERDYVKAALEAAGGSVAEAAKSLGLLPNNLSRKIRELGLR